MHFASVERIVSKWTRMRFFFFLKNETRTNERTKKKCTQTRNNNQNNDLIDDAMRCVRCIQCVHSLMRESSQEAVQSLSCAEWVSWPEPEWLWNLFHFSFQIIIFFIHASARAFAHSQSTDLMRIYSNQARFAVPKKEAPTLAVFGIYDLLSSKLYRFVRRVFVPKMKEKRNHLC